MEAIARIGSYSLDIGSGRWASSRGLDAIFGIEPTFERSIAGWASLIHPADREAMVAYFTHEVIGQGRPFDRQYRIVRADTGAERWVHGLGALKRDGSGRPVQMLGTIADITERVVAEEERSRLVERLRRSERNLAEAQRIAHIGSWGWDVATGAAQRSDETHRIYGMERGAFSETYAAFLAVVHPDDLARVREAERQALAGRAPFDINFRIIRPDGAVTIVREAGEVICNEAGDPVRMVGTTQDITERVAADAERNRLVSAIEQTADAIWMQDLDGMVTYVNRSFSRTYGYEPAEIVGQHAGIIDSGSHGPAFFAEIWAVVAAGGNWTGSIVNRRKDGTSFEVEAVISGIWDAEGRLVSYVQTDRDVTHERALESALERDAREREAIQAALERIDPEGTPEAIAAAACAEIVGLAEIDSAWAIGLGSDNGRILAEVGLVARALSAGTVVPEARAHYLLERAATGPWIEAWRARPEDGTYGEAISSSGLHTAIYAPLKGAHGIVGVIGFGAHDPANADRIVERLPALATFGAVVGALIAPGLEASHREVAARSAIKATIEAGTHTPFFQPIVDLHTGAVVGYEALSRFSDGTRPDVMFGLADRAGLGRRLETATLAAALDAAAVLPAAAYLSLNASPAFIGSGALRALLAGLERPIVLEITEHVGVEDYAALREALAALGPGVRLAVDDAGAGYASLRHILELAPDFVKLDLGLVRGIDADPARQALIAGMTYFAVKRRVHLVAEGIETPAELETLRALAIPYGQGFLLGRPQDGRGPGPWPTTLSLGPGEGTP
ncbi:MAG: EAL domain-containing protein [Chloroflexi bacterium]|nr:EAL domain-containing protein [Chloroflexota bacterium]